MHANVIYLLMGLLLASPILIQIIRARRGQELYIRPIAGLEAIDEAVGRATEMGRPVFFTPGLGSITLIDTLSALSVLSRVAALAAEYDIPVMVTVYDYLTYPVAEEIVREAFVEAGKGEVFSSDHITYITGQFPFAAGSVGIMHRNKVAAAFYFGSFYAESLLLAEAGAQAGAVQVAGTAMSHQLPFLIAACDHVLIGEEYFAAEAYLTEDVDRLGALSGQDLIKEATIVVMIGGAILVTLANLTDWPLLRRLTDGLLGWLSG